MLSGHVLCCFVRLCAVRIHGEAIRPSKGGGRRKIKIEYIEDKNRRHITFSKRKSGIMKKAHELATLTGTEVLLLVVSETGLVYTFSTAKLQPIVSNSEGKQLIQECLNDTAPEEQDGNDQKVTGNIRINYTLCVDYQSLHIQDKAVAALQVAQDSRRQQMQQHEHEPTTLRPAPSPPSPTPAHQHPGSSHSYPSYQSQPQPLTEQQPNPLYAYGYPNPSNQAYPVLSYPQGSSVQSHEYWSTASSSSTFQRQ
ncbi:hypothetical protein BCR43DRAFT_563051 [Syncephalastrum racemosum]|uniref:MADS-box domain-containing protein n=1 Tax=Syncephalastrum racemosum TaxID=13706 RepID=A0A1X2HGP2_SYNRA|nr:hypothetical protein BCR43DRAFT_563051 [Syncephalastrum racemosum]